MEWVLGIAIIYVIGGFWYAGANSMVDINWLWKLYQKYKK